MLSPTGEVIELKPGGVDMAIRYRDSRGPDTGVSPVLIADMVVVATPSLIGAQAITEPEVLLDMPWLQELGTNEVADWFVRHGVMPEGPLKITHMPGNLIMEAVRRGDGITFTAQPFVEEEIRSGRLIELFPETAFGTYYIVARPGVLRPPVRAFVKWLKRQAAR